MASIITDGPRTWAVDVLDHKLGRAFAVVAGANMLATVHLLDPGRGFARSICAVFAGLFLLLAIRPPRQPPHRDLVRLEAAVERLEEQFELHEDFAAVHVDVVRDLIADIHAQVR